MAYPFAAAEVLTAANLNAMIGAPTQNAQTGVTYTLALLDAGKTVTFSNASPVAVTVPLQSSVTWAANTQINLLNIGAGLVTIAGDVGVTINGTPLTLAQNARGILIRTASNTWTFVPSDSGKVLQVVRATDTTNRSTTSTTFVDVTGMAVTITPQRNTSAILLIATGYMRSSWSTGDDGRSRLRITNSSGTAISGAEISVFGPLNLSGSGTRQVEHEFNTIAYATPATTSPVTFKLQMESATANITTLIVNGSRTGQMYAIEVAA
jgi:hypothetical protein